jgi:hypothetical protein
MLQVRGQPSRKDIDFLSIDCYPVAVGIAAQADQWKRDYGAVLHDSASVLLEGLCTRMVSVVCTQLHNKTLSSLLLCVVLACCEGLSRSLLSIAVRCCS